MTVFAQNYFSFTKPILDSVEGIEKSAFTVRKRVLIESLCPNQVLVEPLLISHKRKGNNLTTPYVLIYKGYNILMDGHHTTIAKKLNGQKYIIALTLEIKA